MIEKVKRMRYFNTLFLKEEEFKLEQNYHMRMRRLHNRRLHTYGIAYGLDVKNDNGLLKVTGGMALDNITKTEDDEGNAGEKISREIVLPDDANLPLKPAQITSGVYICIYHNKEKEGPNLEKGGKDESGAIQMIHWEERAEIEAIAVAGTSKQTLESQGKIVLAKVQDNSGNITDGSIKYDENNSPLRTYAGAYGKLTLSIEKEDDDSKLPFIEGRRINDQNGIYVNSDVTQIKGKCIIDGELVTNGSTTTINTDNLVVEDNIITINKKGPFELRNAGLEVYRGSESKALLIWDELVDKWKLGLEGSLTEIVYRDSGGNIRNNERNIWLKGGNDENHGIGWFGLGKLFANVSLDGPAVFGFSGGALGTRKSGDRIALQWDSDGNVGIGTQPSSKLEIAGSSGNVLRAGASTGSTANIDLSGHVQLKEYSNHNRAYFQARDDTSNRNIGLRIRTQKAGTSSPSIIEAVTIDHTGNVGIGTSPERILDVAGQITLRTGNSSNAGIWLKNKDNQDEWFMGKTNIFGLNQIGFWKSDWRMVIQDNGNVGIGSVPSTERLEVSGNVKATQFIGDGSRLTNMPSGSKWSDAAGGIYYNNMVGIGTDKPGAKLQVSGGAIMPSSGSDENSGILFPKDPGGGSGDAAWIRYYNRSRARWDKIAENEGKKVFTALKRDYAVSSDTPAVFKKANDMTMTASIGTKTASLALNNDRTKATLRIDGIEKAVYDVVKENDILNVVLAGGENTTLEIGISDNAEDHIALMPSGGVGIGKDEPKAKLHVSGSIRSQFDPGKDSTPDINSQFELVNRGELGQDSNRDYIWRIYTAAIGGGFGVNPNSFEIWEYPSKFESPGTCCRARLRIKKSLSNKDPEDVVINESGRIVLEGWKSPVFENNWQNYLEGYNPAGYYIDKQGIVHLRGLIKGGTIDWTNGFVFTLPPGYRPENRELFAVISNDVIGRCDVRSDGKVIAVKGINGWFTLDGITFRAK